CQGGLTCPSSGGAPINSNPGKIGGIVTEPFPGTGATTINVGGTVYAFGTNTTGNADAIHATSTAGNINITTGHGVPGNSINGANNLSVFSQFGNAIFANSTAGGNISVTTGSGLVMGATGINLTTTSTGTITVAAGTGGVTGTAGDGI